MDREGSSDNADLLPSEDGIVSTDAVANPLPYSIDTGAGDDFLNGEDIGLTVLDANGDPVLDVNGDPITIIGFDGYNDFEDVNNFVVGRIELSAPIGNETGGLSFAYFSNGSDPINNPVPNEQDLSNPGSQANYSYALLIGTNFTEIPCFAVGTLILTPTGPRPVENLEVDDLVTTMDGGAKAIRWISSRTITPSKASNPVIIKAGVLDNDRDLCVSPQHRMLISGAKAELMFGEAQVLVKAIDLTILDDVYQAEFDQVCYVHFFFDSHQIVFAEGAPTESFRPGRRNMQSMDVRLKEELLSIFPELRDNPEAIAPVRPSLKTYEAKSLLH